MHNMMHACGQWGLSLIFFGDTLHEYRQGTGVLGYLLVRIVYTLYYHINSNNQGELAL